MQWPLLWTLRTASLPKKQRQKSFKILAKSFKKSFKKSFNERKRKRKNKTPTWDEKSPNPTENSTRQDQDRQGVAGRRRASITRIETIQQRIQKEREKRRHDIPLIVSVGYNKDVATSQRHLLAAGSLAAPPCHLHTHTDTLTRADVFVS